MSNLIFFYWETKWIKTTVLLEFLSGFGSSLFWNVKVCVCVGGLVKQSFFALASAVSLLNKKKPPKSNNKKYYIPSAKIFEYFIKTFIWHRKLQIFVL